MRPILSFMTIIFVIASRGSSFGANVPKLVQYQFTAIVAQPQKYKSIKPLSGIETDGTNIEGVFSYISGVALNDFGIFHLQPPANVEIGVGTTTILKPDFDLKGGYYIAIQGDHFRFCMRDTEAAREMGLHHIQFCLVANNEEPIFSEVDGLPDEIPFNKFKELTFSIQKGIAENGAVDIDITGKVTSIRRID